jgi:hypothetical protein
MKWFKTIWGETDALRPIEIRVLSEVGMHLSDANSQLMRRQLESVNKVQRFTDDREVNLFHMVRGKAFFDESLLFANRTPEARLATLKLRAKSAPSSIRAEVWLAHGRIFSVTFDSPPRLWTDDTVEIESVRLWTNPMEADTEIEARPATQSDVARLERWLDGVAAQRAISDALAPPSELWLERRLSELEYGFTRDVVELFGISGGFRIDDYTVHGLSSIRTIILECGEFVVIAEKTPLEVLAILRDHSGAFYRLSPDGRAPEDMGTDLKSSLRRFLASE